MKLILYAGAVVLLWTGSVFADLELTIDKIEYKPSNEVIPGALKGTIHLSVRVTNPGDLAEEFSTEGLGVRILRKVDDKK